MKLTMAARDEDLIESDSGRAGQLLDRLVGVQGAAAVGALLAGIAPAVMATAEGNELRGSVSAYYDVDPRTYFWGPFTAAAFFLLLDGLISYVSANRDRYGRRWYNIVLSIALFLLTWFNYEDASSVHYPAATVFFALFIAVIAYTSLLGVAGRPIDRLNRSEAAGRPIDRVLSTVSLAFMGLLILSLAAWVGGFITFYFFEVFALVNFALYYVQGLVHPFPYNEYEFTIGWLNRVLRFLRIMHRA